MLLPPDRVSPCKGNAVLEMLLFVPIAFFLLFTVIDLGVYYTQLGSLKDTVRGTLTSETAWWAKSRGVHIDDSLMSTDNITAFSELAESVTAELQRRILSNSSKVVQASNKAYRIDTYLFSIAIDPISGKRKAARPTAIAHASSSNLHAGGGERIPESLEETALSLIESAALELPIVKVLPEHQGINTSPTAARYLPYALVLYVNTAAISGGINPLYSAHVMNNNGVLHQQVLFPVRDLF